jgi:mono/diheme cytochrome c family protein
VVDEAGVIVSSAAGVRRRVAAAMAAAAVLAGCGTDDDLQAQRERGEELYGRHCVDCHGGATGGEISDIPPPHNAEGHTWHHPDCELVEITLGGLPPRQGHPTMPAFEGQLSEDEVEAILEHLRTWWEPDQRDHQAEVTEQVCD